MKLTFYNEVIQFDYELGTLIKASEDPMFTSYLSDIKNDIQNNPGRVPEYRQQVIDNYSIYSEKMNNLGCPVERFFFKAVYGDMEAPEIKNSVFTSDAPADQSEDSEQPVQDDQSSYVDDNEAVEEAHLDTLSEVYEESVEESQPAAFETVQMSQPAAFDPYTGRPLNQPVHNAYPSSSAKKTEFAVGAIVMSIIGSVFLLTGLVYFSINFLDTFAQGMVMYLVCAIVLCVSEFVIRRLVPKLSAVFTAIGISGVFLTTVVNYKSLGNLNLPVTAIILGVCAILVCFFGYIRKSQLYSIIGFLAAFVSSIAIGTHVTPTEYMVITLCTLIISSLWLIFPVEKYYSAVTPVMLFSEMVYMISGNLFSISDCSDFTEKILKVIFSLCSMIVINFIYFLNAKRCRKNGSANEVVTVFNVIIYSITVLVFAGMFSISNRTLSDLSETSVIVINLILYFAVVALEGVFTFLLKEKKDHHFVLFYISTQVIGFLFIVGINYILIQAVLLMAHALFSRFMTKYECVCRPFKLIDLILQAVYIIPILLLAFDVTSTASDYIGMIIIIAGLTACIFIGLGYQNLIQIFSVFSSTIVLAVLMDHLLDNYSFALGSGVVLLFTFLINRIDRIKGKNANVFNWFALVWTLIMLISESQTYYSTEIFLLFMITAVFGLALVILLMNKEYGMPFYGKYIMIPGYLTFISFLMPLHSGFVHSIILMAIAVISVIIGFVLKEKTIRVYGLILSIVICAKIALIDFVAMGDVKAKTIMYILVGALALAIGCIYMVLESRENKAARMVAAQAPQYAQPQPGQVHYAQPAQVQYDQPQYEQPEMTQSENIVSVEGNTENKELYEENKTV